ncbi:MAG: sulfotransferase [Rhizomicrobium sp.]
MNSHLLYEAALALQNAGSLAEAEQQYRTLLRSDPGHIEALQQLGTICIDTGRYAEAGSAFEQAIALAPGVAESHANLGIALHAGGRLEEALRAFARAIALKPELIEPYMSTGHIHLALGQFEEALYWFQRALALRPDFPMALDGIGKAQIELGNAAEALVVYNKLLALNSRSAPGAFGKGKALEQLGRGKEARKAYELAVALSPETTGYHYELATCARFVANDPRLVALERLAQRLSNFSSTNQMLLHFALAKAYDDLGHYAQAFQHLTAGNAIRRRLSRYDEAADIGLTRAIANAFTANVFEGKRGMGHPSELPVFVIGMPRSGTTLVEQILASHPEVFGAGELKYLHKLIGYGYAGENFPAGIMSLSGEDLRRCGGFYATRLSAHAPKARRIVDKMPANFRLIGLIHLALPKARIIHVRRDPLDTCFSCYAGMFAPVGMEFSYDLGSLGRYYKAYEELMAHWRAVLPPATMLEVDYERLVDDLEAQARRIVGYCGLDWNPRCLDFHRTDRVVITGSAFQVRRPIYRTSIGRATPYAPWLGTLREALQLAAAAH